MSHLPVQSESAAQLVSVVMPTYNRALFITQALESVLSQSYPNIELIVVDDGSTDDTAQVLSPYLHRVRYIRQENQGVARARNAGLEVARGAFLCFLDSDDAWLPQKVERQVEFAQRNPQYGLISTEISGFTQTGEPIRHSKTHMYDIHNGFVMERLLFGNWIQTSTVMIRRECLNAIGGFDEEVGQFGEDWLLWMRIAAKYPIYFLPEPLVNYRVHANSLMSHLPESQYESLMQIYDKLERLPELEQRRHLVSEARYRVALHRGWGDLRSGNIAPAIRKLRDACSEKRMPVKAAVLLLLAQIRSYLQYRRAAGAKA